MVVPMGPVHPSSWCWFPCKPQLLEPWDRAGLSPMLFKQKKHPNFPETFRGCAHSLRPTCQRFCSAVTVPTERTRGWMELERAQVGSARREVEPGCGCGTGRTPSRG